MARTKKKNEETAITADVVNALESAQKSADATGAKPVEETLVESTCLSPEGRSALYDAFEALDGDTLRVKKTRRLTYTLTTEERQDKRNESVMKLGLRDEVDGEIKALQERVAGLKKRREALDSDAIEFQRVAAAGHELRDVECVEIFDPLFVIPAGDDDGQLEKGALVTIRRDLFERASKDDDITQARREELREEAIVDKRPADKTVRQGSLFS